MTDSKVKLIIRYVLEIILAIILYAILDNVSGIKKYIVVVSASLLLGFFSRKREWFLEVLIFAGLPVCCYVILGSISALIAGNSQVETVKVILYVCVPLFLAFSLYTFYGAKMDHAVNIQFVGSVLAYSIFDAPYFAKIFHWESIYSFVFGIFVIYYVYQKKWKLASLAMLFVIFTEKRIVILAILAVIVVMAVMWLFEENKKLALVIWGITIGIVFVYLYLIYSGIMVEFCWGANINTNGRVEIYSKMASEAKFSLLYFGKGLGTVENLLQHWNVLEFENLHSDLLKFYIELGFLGLLTYLISYGIVFLRVEEKIGKREMCYYLSLMIYTIVLFATDNVSIYMIYLIPMYSTVFAVLSSNKIEIRKQDD